MDEAKENILVDDLEIERKEKVKCHNSFRSSRPEQKQPPEVFCKKAVLRNFAKFTVKYLCQSLFFNKVTRMRPAFLLKKRI